MPDDGVDEGRRLLPRQSVERIDADPTRPEIRSYVSVHGA